MKWRGEKALWIGKSNSALGKRQTNEQREKTVKSSI